MIKIFIDHLPGHIVRWYITFQKKEEEENKLVSTIIDQRKKNEKE